MLNQRLQIAEYIFIAGSVIGCAVAVASGQLIYAAVSVSVSLVLNLINRLRFEQRIRRRIAAAITQLHRQLLEESQALQAQQLQAATASLPAKLPGYLADRTTSDSQPSDRQLVLEELSNVTLSQERHLSQIKAQLGSLEESLTGVVQYLNSASLVTRVEQLENAIAEIAQMHRSQPDGWHNRIEAIERQLQVIRTQDAPASLTESVTQPSLLSQIPHPIQPPNLVPPLPTWSHLTTLRGHSDWVSSLKITPDGQTLASGSFDQTIKLWQLPTGELIHTLSNHAKGVMCLAISPDGQTLASGSFDETINLWRLDTGELMHTLTGHSGSVRTLAISPDSQTLISGSFDESIKLWDLDRGTFLANLAKRSGTVSAIALTPDGSTLASGGGDGHITLRQLAPLDPGTKPAFTLTLTGNLSSVGALAISQDGEMLAAGCTDGNVKVWQLGTGELIHIITGHLGPVLAVVFSVDSQTLISGSADSTIKIWHLKTGQQLGTLANESAGSVMSVAISPDGQLITVGSADHTIKIWQRD